MNEDLEKTTNSSCSDKEKEIIKKVRDNRKNNQKNALKKLIWVSIICVIFLSVEFVGSIYAKSTFLFSDALHLFSDFYGFAISMFSIYLSSKPPNDIYSYGFYRVEVLGAILSVISIWGITGWILYEAIMKIILDSFDIEENILLIISIIGLLANILMAQILHSSGHDMGLDMKNVLILILKIKKMKI